MRTYEDIHLVRGCGQHPTCCMAGNGLQPKQYLIYPTKCLTNYSSQQRSDPIQIETNKDLYPINIPQSVITRQQIEDDETKPNIIPTKDVMLRPDMQRFVIVKTSVQGLTTIEPRIKIMELYMVRAGNVIAPFMHNETIQILWETSHLYGYIIRNISGWHTR